jgi:hypothetical protein
LMLKFTQSNQGFIIYIYFFSNTTDTFLHFRTVLPNHFHITAPLVNIFCYKVAPKFSLRNMYYIVLRLSTYKITHLKQSNIQLYIVNYTNIHCILTCNNVRFFNGNFILLLVYIKKNCKH